MTCLIPCALTTGTGKVTANVGDYTERVTSQAMFFLFYGLGTY